MLAVPRLLHSGFSLISPGFFHLYILNRQLLKGLVVEAERNRVEEGWTSKH